jgi:hypothetical protein
MVSDAQRWEEAANAALMTAEAEAAQARAERDEQARQGQLPVSPDAAWADMHDSDLAGPEYTGGYHIEGEPAGPVVPPWARGGAHESA